MFGLGVPEVALILVIGLVVFGPGKLPEVGKAVGKSLREFKAASEEAGGRGRAGRNRSAQRKNRLQNP